MGMSMQEELLHWYAENKRELPFRKDKDPYKIWISEIMAQQTRIEAMRAYFERWIERFPALEDLAKADEQEVLSLWSGLGYYARARNLHKCAKVCMEKHSGKLPEDYETLKKLPGIGDYTAGAIASIAFDTPAAAVDANVIRIYTRRFAIDQPDSPALRKEITALVQSEISKEHPGDFNQALMELGSLICLPKTPKCLLCPVSNWCKSAFSPDAAALPVKKEKKQRSVEQKEIWLWCAKQDGKWHVLVKTRPKTGMLAGMHEFCSHPKADTSMENALDLGFYRHVFTHKEWHMHGFAIETDWSDTDKGVYMPAENLIETCALPSAFTPFLERLQSALQKGNPFDKAKRLSEKETEETEK
jgi:A/G-specific adenine glycosylase